MSKYTKSEDEIIVSNYGITPITLWADKLPTRTIDAIASRARRLKLKSGLIGNQITTGAYVKPTFIPDLPNPDGLTFEELWEAGVVFQHASKRLSTRQNTPTIHLDVDHPIAVCFVADTHIGALDTPLDVVRARFDLLEEYPWIYPAGCGDMTDNYVPTSHAAGMFGALFPPELQKELVENLYARLKGRWLWLIQGCHDEWSHNADDFDLTKYMSKNLGCVNLGFGGLVKLMVGAQEYQIAVRHKYRYNSSYNLTHAPKQLVRFDEQTADIAVVAHNHVSAIEQVQEKGKDRMYIRTGSMKGADRWARSVGFTDTGKNMPCVVLWPNKRQMMGFMDLEQCADYMQSLGLGRKTE